MNYNSVQSMEEIEFNKKRVSDHELEDSNKFEVTSSDVKARIERLLDVLPGTLGDTPYYFQSGACPNGHKLSMYDFVFTALIDAGHHKSFILHTLVGTKRVVNAARLVRCSVCAEWSPSGHAYNMSNYACSSDP
ncbi:hypothetical protein CFBP4996_19670 [Agrobacterium leguminum]|uniref:hypothetical protein n=1 Tax=Agrobacterium TaxID=357 RepID=UPI0010CA0E07|nr:MULTISPECIES: hypothetical protein [Agrobacterium]WFS68235.1 hypothetical protein CFBP4996_19670 [Agrobacterium leguminum]